MTALPIQVQILLYFNATFMKSIAIIIAIKESPLSFKQMLWYVLLISRCFTFDNRSNIRFADHETVDLMSL